MKRATEKQLKYLRFLVNKTGAEQPDWEFLTKGQASELIGQLLNVKLRQTELSLPPEPLPPDDPSIPPEVTEFKRWASGVYQRGEQNIVQLSALYDEKFGNPFKTL
jgi:hypothetical protein